MLHYQHWSSTLYVPPVAYTFIFFDAHHYHAINFIIKSFIGYLDDSSQDLKVSKKNEIKMNV